MDGVPVAAGRERSGLERSDFGARFGSYVCGVFQLILEDIIPGGPTVLY